MNEERPPFTLSDKWYDRAKWLVIIILPATGTLYFALSQIWGLPGGEKTLGTIVAVQAFLGVALGISSKSYMNSEVRYDGDMEVEEHPSTGAKRFNLALNADPEKLEEKKELIFKVKKMDKSIDD